jgi:uncharacterized membrane protein YdjX (TVP38/TMEM64 family)
MSIRRGRAAAQPRGRSFRLVSRAAFLMLVAAGICAAWYCRAELEPAALAAAIAQHPFAPLVFLGLHILASLLFVPRTVLAAAAGIAFGVAWGVVWAAAGSVVGALAGFWLARYLNSGFFDVERTRRLGPAFERIARGGWRAVALLRLIPVVPHSLANYGLGLTRLPAVAYAAGSLLGQLPMTVACVELGAAGERLAAGAAGWLLPSMVGAAALGLSWLVPALFRPRPL